MFDPETVALISTAPPLEGLDLADLPRRLTDAFATIVATRIRIREAYSLPDSEDLAPLLSEMRRLAFTNESLVSALSSRDNRAGAAFVAGAAHQVRLLADRMKSAPSRSSSITYQSISPEVSATLLFLIAEASADAAEASKAIVVPDGITPQTLLLTAIKSLAEGRLGSIIELPNPDELKSLSTDMADQAVHALYAIILQGVKALASEILRRPTPEAESPS